MTIDSVSSPGLLTAIPSAIVKPCDTPPANGAHAAACTPTMRRPGFSSFARDRDARREPTAADRDDDGPDVRQLLDQLEADRPLARDHPLVLEGVHERRSARLRVCARVLLRVVEHLAAELDPGAVVLRRLDLRDRCVLRHEDRRVDPALARSPRHGLRVIARADGDDARRTLLVGKRRDAVDRAADLERARALEVLRLQPHLTPGHALEGLGDVDRRLARGAVNPLARGADVSECGRCSRRQP